VNVYILVDAEGITGVVNHELQVAPDSPRYEEMRGLFMSDLNAAVEGAVQSGADGIVVYDMHYYGLNARLDELHPRARIVLGKPPKIEPPAGIDPSFDALVMIGYHSMAGTGCLLNHTYTLDMKELRLNGVLMGEIGLEAAMAGFHDVPLVMASGDDAAEREARELLGEVEFACVKYGTGTKTALCLPASRTADLIGGKVEAALKGLDRFEPYRVQAPYTIEIEFFDASSVKKAISIPGVAKKSTTKIELRGDDLPRVWEDFLSGYTASG
jgi:D-amino peptidase